MKTRLLLVCVGAFVLATALSVPSLKASDGSAATEVGRWKLDGDGGCYWDDNDDGPNQCDPNDPAGRYRFDGSTCVWDQSQHPPDECTPSGGGGGGGGGGGQYPPLDVKIVWTDLASSNREFDLYHVGVGDGDTVVDTVAGLEVRRNADPNDDFYMYFNVKDQFAFQGSKQSLFITFHYWDGPANTLRIQYDALTDPYFNGPEFTTTGTNKWKTKTVGFKNVYFGNRQNNGADFRIASTPGAYFYVDLVYVRELPTFTKAWFNPQYHIPPGTTPNPAHFLNTCLNLGQWSSGLAGIQYFGGVYQSMTNGGDADLTNCFDNLKQHDKRLTMEMGVIKEPNNCTGSSCFNAVYPSLQRFSNLGASMDVAAFDLPLTGARTLRNNHDMAWAAQETAVFMSLLRNAFPHMQQFLIENLKYVSANDMVAWMQALDEECARIGTPMIDMLVIDADYNDGGINHASLAGIQDSVRSIGPRFGISYFGAGATSNAQYYQKVMNQAAAFYNFGIYPDVYWLTSWDPYPDVMIPETSSYSHTWTLLQFLNWIY